MFAVSQKVVFFVGFITSPSSKYRRISQDFAAFWVFCPHKDPPIPTPLNPNVFVRVSTGLWATDKHWNWGVRGCTLGVWWKLYSLGHLKHGEILRNTTVFTGRGRYKKRQKCRDFFCFFRLQKNETPWIPIMRRFQIADENICFICGLYATDIWRSQGPTLVGTYGWDHEATGSQGPNAKSLIF